LCVASTDLCEINTCTSSGCLKTRTECKPFLDCYTATCNSKTGECDYTPLNCDDGVPCTIDTCENNVCQHTAVVCDDKSACTTDSCVAGSCSTQTITCDDGIACTIDSCDAKLGCVHTPSDDVCKSADPCVMSKCNVTMKGCVNSNVTCASTGKHCLASRCINYQGCVNETKSCSSNSSAVCSFISCKEDQKSCVEELLVCGAAIDTTVLVGSILGTAAIAGIICALVVVVFGVGGGTAFAYYQGGIGGGSAVTANNPIYKEDTSSGTNPLHQG